MTRLEEVNKANVQKYGPLQECCNQFEKYCRCFISEHMKNNHYERGVPVNVIEKLRKEYKK
jgi:hypothetical protein